MVEHGPLLGCAEEFKLPWQRLIAEEIHMHRSALCGMCRVVMQE